MSVRREVGHSFPGLDLEVTVVPDVVLGPSERIERVQTERVELVELAVGGEVLRGRGRKGRRRVSGVAGSVRLNYPHA